jgi:hypothetical protein
MTIAELVDIFEGHATTMEYPFFCGLKSHYNREKKITDIIILVPPKEWPLNWRADCSYDVEVEVWIGKMVNLRTDRQDETYPLATIRDTLNADANTLIGLLNTDDYVQVLTDDISASYWSPEEGATINTQEFVSFPLTLKVWSS